MPSYLGDGIHAEVSSVHVRVYITKYEHWKKLLSNNFPTLLGWLQGSISHNCSIGSFLYFIEKDTPHFFT